jgi:hypothetical protein
MHASCNACQFQHVGSTWLTRVHILHHQSPCVKFSLVPSLIFIRSVSINDAPLLPLRYSVPATGPPAPDRMRTPRYLMSTTPTCISVSIFSFAATSFSYTETSSPGGKDSVLGLAASNFIQWGESAFTRSRFVEL